MLSSEKCCEIFGFDASITQNAAEKLGMQSLPGMKRDSNSSPGRVLVNHMASTLTRKEESHAFSNSHNLSSRNPWQLGHQTEISTVERLTDLASVRSSWSAW